MKYSAYNISLDIHEHASQAVINAKKSDTGRKLHITLRAGGTPYTIEDNCYAVFKATKPDNTILFNACTIENNEIIYEFTEQTCTSVGRLRCEIALYGQDGKIITSPCFTMLVDGLIYPDEHIESTDEFSALTGLISDTLEATDGARQATENAVDATENANRSSESANQSAEQASQAAQNAVTASENANGAAGRANEATNAANDATSNANNAAENANETATNLVRIVKNAMTIGQVEGVSPSLDDAVELGFVGCRIFGKTIQDGTPTPDAPVDLISSVDGDRLSLFVTGKNLFTGWIVGGVHPATGEDYAVTTQRRTDYIPISAPGQKYSISKIPNTLFNLVAFYDANKTYISRTAAGPSGGRLIEPPATAKYFRVSIYENAEASGKIAEADTMANTTMIEAGSIVTAYEPAKPIQKATVTTPNGLHGIPVTSGGNYTDANGQQWICDEIDFAKGVHIQRIGDITLDGSQVYYINNYQLNTSNRYLFDWYSNDILQATTDVPAISNKLIYGNWGTFSSAEMRAMIYATSGRLIVFLPGQTIKTVEEFKAYLISNPIRALYKLNEPIETPLTAEELAAYASLYTYRDNTTVSNDAGAYTELEYVMDAKKYIDSLVASSTIHQATVE